LHQWYTAMSCFGMMNASQQAALSEEAE
jgi:hypothetical protein